MVAVDIRFMSDDMQDGVVSSGVGLFCLEVLDGIRSMGDAGEVALIAEHRQKVFIERELSDFEIRYLNNTFNDMVSFWLYPLRFFVDSLKLRKMVKNMQADCVWLPFTSPFYFLDGGVPTISTLHDIIPFRENPKSISWKMWGKLIINKSKRIITDSYYVKKDIETAYSISESPVRKKIQPIPCPVVIDFSKTEPVEKLKGKTFILDVNAYQKRKNGITLLRAFSRIKDDTNMDLVFCGGYESDGVLDSLKKESYELNLQDRVFFFLSISVEQRNWLFVNSSLLVSPSLSEGFGRTPVEAAMSGIPVLTTKVDSLVEVTEGLVNYYEEPENDEELSRAMLSILNNPPSKDKLITISQKLHDKYDKFRIAEKYLDLF